ncbi:recombinase family protein [Sulfitobacter geojensis]|uniref:recombinase family protein n=1 Tax=Sulfitobacter geojensis TaxID=1342299 RepID=UPI00046AA510|nr:recombinase family protein [Sulfitobacter geojensis]NYI29062.1 DNA invertase Pin-like site-specific DNA recombinase [Sulfitobacter geojensis]
MTDVKYVSYLRVSTGKQGRSGLGLEAQRHAVEAHLNGGHWEVVEEFVEVESGKSNGRPMLTEAIELCHAIGATLIVAKIDRLTRDAAFLLSLKDAGVEFVAADMPNANRLTVGIMALVAEQESEATSKRTREALQAAKVRGVQLGAYRDGVFVGRVGTAEDAKRASIARSEKYRASAAKKAAILGKVDPERTLSLRQIAQRLNSLGVPTVSGRGLWSANSVRRLQSVAKPLAK